MWGGNESNKLGLKSSNPKEISPKLVEMLNAIKKISLGYQHSAAISASGELFTWGHGFYGQLGHGDVVTRSEPKKVEFNDLKFKKVKCGSYQTVAIDRKGLVYIWGRGGMNLNLEPTKNKTVPELVSQLFLIN